MGINSFFLPREFWNLSCQDLGKHPYLLRNPDGLDFCIHFCYSFGVFLRSLFFFAKHHQLDYCYLVSCLPSDTHFFHVKFLEVRL